MAARPQLTAFSAEVAERGGDHIILDRVADGEPMRAIAADFGVSRGMLYLWIKAGGEDRQTGFDLARKASADALVEDGLQILDDLDDHADVTSAQVAAASARANYRKWMATVSNRERYGDKQEINVKGGIAHLHLEALRAAGGMKGRMIEAPDAEQIQEAEVLAIEPAQGEVEAPDEDSEVLAELRAAE